MRPERVFSARIFATAMLLAMCADAASATPSSTMWTNMTPDIQPRGVVHVGVDNYFTVARKFEDGAGDFPTYFHPDVSLLTGPVWFNDEDVNGKWKWTIQLDANRVVFGK